MHPPFIALLAGLFGRPSSAVPDAPKALALKAAPSTASGLAFALSRPTPAGAMDLGLRHLGQGQKRRNRRRAWAAGDRSAFRKA